MKQNNKPQGKNERTNKMNKKIIASLASVAIIVTMVTVASCATNADNNAATNAIQETTTEINNDGQNPVMNFIGNYYGGRACINVEPEGTNDAKITVTWSSSYDQKAVWTMSGFFNEETTSVAYNNGIKKIVTYNEKGEVISEEVDSTNCKGVFVFDNDGVTWDEQNEHIADNMVFKFGSSAEEAIGDAGTTPVPEQTNDKTTETTVETTSETEAKPTEAPKATETEKPTEKPTETEATEPYVEPADPAHRTAAQISGTYVSGRATATVDASDPNNVTIKIVWSESVDTQAIWRISGRYNEETETILYDGAVKKVLTYDESGNVVLEEVDYTDGSGAILFSYDGFTWDDYVENVANNMVFIKSA